MSEQAICIISHTGKIINFPLNNYHHYNTGDQEDMQKTKHCKACPITNVDEIPLVLSVDDLCEILSIGKNSAYALIKSGDLSCVRIGRNIRIPRTDLIEYLNRI